MQDKLTLIKNLAWALAIFVMLLSLLLGLLFAAFVRYDGEMERPQVQLGKKVSAAPESAPEGAPEEALEGAPVQTATGKVVRLAETADARQEYIDRLTFLCDSATAGLREYGLLSGGTDTTQLWRGEYGSLPADTLESCTVVYPDGSLISPAQAAMIARPEILIIAVGQDGLASVTQERFIEKYESLVRSIQEKSKQTIVVCCSIVPVGANYAGSDGLSADLIIRANDWVEQVCKDTGAYFCDAARELRDSSGVLNSSYASANGKTLNSTGLKVFLDYLRTHAVT